MLGKLLKVQSACFRIFGDAEVTLRASSATVGGTVTDATMQPVSGVNVVPCSVGPDPLRSLTQRAYGSNGRYSIANRLRPDG
jgi:hypothetical protein